MYGEKGLWEQNTAPLTDGVGAASVLLVQPLASAMHLPFTTL